MSSESHGRLSENVIFDDDHDIATIYGVNVAGIVLRTLSELTPPGHWFRIIKVEDGLATIQCKREEDFK